jgi:quercetin dioxygenase-like cupin family protein
MFGKENEERGILGGVVGIRRRVLLTGAAVALLAASSFAAGTALATPGQGVTQTSVASGVLPEPVRMKLKDEVGFGDGIEVSNVSIVKNVIQPGGYFGWHQHGGPSWIVVTQGTLTFYDGDDATCTGHPVSAGNAYLDLGDHTHNARNETNTPVENYVIRMLPAGGVTRIDMPDPGVCPF